MLVGLPLHTETDNPDVMFKRFVTTLAAVTVLTVPTLSLTIAPEPTPERIRAGGGDIPELTYAMATVGQHAVTPVGADVIVSDNPDVMTDTYSEVTVESVEDARQAELKAVEDARLAEEARVRAEAEAAESRRVAEEASKKRGGSQLGVAPAAGVPDVGSSKEYAKNRLASQGLGDDEYSCLVSLWQKESGWNEFAANPSSGAYGIPQSLPGSKMASAGADWATNAQTQINWGLGYIENRYGTPCKAWAKSQTSNWY